MEKEQEDMLAESLRAQEKLRECVEQLDPQLTRKAPSISELLYQLGGLQKCNGLIVMRQVSGGH